MASLSRYGRPRHLREALKAALLAADPDGSRLRMGARATLASALCALVLSRAASALGIPATTTLVGAFVGMQAAALITDISPRDQRITSLWMAPVASAALVTGTLVAPYRFVSLAVFCAVIFAAVAVRRYGPRGNALGVLGFSAYFFALFFQGSARDLPWILAAAVFGAAIAYAVRYFLVPDRPEKQLRRALASLDLQMARSLELAAKALVARWEGPSVQALRDALDRANETALIIEDLVPLAPPIGDVLSAELALGRATATARTLGTNRDAPEESLLAIADALVLAAEALRGDSSAQDRLEIALDVAAVACEGSASAGALKAQIERLRRALCDLSRKAGSMDRKTAEPEPGHEPDGTGAHPAQAQTPGLHPMTRQAIQATVAGALAMAVGHWISPSRWVWAVLTAFIVLTRATTVDEIVVRAWSRTAGTLVGVFAGMGLAVLVQGHPRLDIVLLFACVFFGFYALRASYATMVAFITAAVALLYSLLGRYSPSLLYLRLEETLAGAVIGAAVSAVVLPSRTGPKVRAALAALLGETAAYLDGLVAASPAGERRAFAAGARALDRQLRDLRAAAEPFTPRPFFPARKTARTVSAAARLVFSLRQLASAGISECLGERRVEVEAIARRLAENARVLSSAVAEEQPREAGARGESASFARALSGETLDPSLPSYWLQRVEVRMLELADALGILLALAA